jgi:glycosyltransferase involved in cell wall biosynthesis
MTNVRLRYAAQLDPEQWASRHARGEVPDRLPYGLHRLARPGRSLDVDVPPRGMWALAGRASRAVTGGYELFRLRRSRSADVEVAWDEGVGIPTALKARSGVAVATGVIWLTDRRRKGGSLVALERRALQRCSAVWALSSAQLPLLRSVWRVDSGRLHHLKFGVDQGFWSASMRTARPVQVLAVGNDRDRDHPTAVRAVELARSRLPDMRLHLVTNHPVPVPSEVGVRTSALSHVDLREQYQKAAVCVIAVRPNLHCSGVTAALEAMACSRPVIVSDTPGMSDYVTHGVNGLLVPPGDAAAIASAICRVLANPGLAADLGEAGRWSVEDSFNTVRQAEQLADILDHM